MFEHRFARLYGEYICYREMYLEGDGEAFGPMEDSLEDLLNIVYRERGLYLETYNALFDVQIELASRSR